jgi:hypothetical protein
MEYLYSVGGYVVDSLKAIATHPAKKVTEALINRFLSAVINPEKPIDLN